MRRLWAGLLGDDMNPDIENSETCSRCGVRFGQHFWPSAGGRCDYDIDGPAFERGVGQVAAEPQSQTAYGSIAGGRMREVEEPTAAYEKRFEATHPMPGSAGWYARPKIQFVPTPQPMGEAEKALRGVLLDLELLQQGIDLISRKALMAATSVIMRRIELIRGDQ